MLAKGDHAFGRHSFVASATLRPSCPGSSRSGSALGALVAGIGWIGM
jgi:hypothetical protein